MNDYVDIEVLPDLDISAPVLMSNLFAKLHRQLGQVAAGRVGVSFPRHGKTPGNLLRLHGDQIDLTALMAHCWLKGLRDYTSCGAIQPVPADVQHRVVKRIQKKSSHNRRKRSIAKGWLSEEEACIRIPDTGQKHIHLPYLQLRSLSNGHIMRIYIAHGMLMDEPTAGKFNAYGLSLGATIPWF